MVSSVSIPVLICLEKVGELYLCRKWQPSNMLHVLILVIVAQVETDYRNFFLYFGNVCRH